METANNGWKSREKYLAYQKAYNIKRRDKERLRYQEKAEAKRIANGIYNPIPCKYCSKLFIREKTTPHQSYCSKECTQQGANLANRIRRQEVKSGLRPEMIPNLDIKNHHNKKINCEICSKEFITASCNQKICSSKCKKARAKIYERRYSAKQMNVTYSAEKYCTICNQPLPKSKTWNSKTCSDECSKRLKLRTTYDRLNGNWERYLRTLCRKRQDEFRCKQFDEHDLIKILEKQNYKCALTGVELTCNVRLNEDSTKKRAVFRTNVSIDRIDNKIGYTIDNVHLVCYVVNVARHDCTIDEYINWCKKVTEYNKDEKNCTE
jgi:hypothetical protein